MWPKGKPSWCKGLTKETDASIARTSIKVRMYRLGKHLSDETKKKLSLALKGRIPKNKNPNYDVSDIDIVGKFPLGTIRRGRDIGKAGKVLFIWAACEECKEERWVRILRGSASNILCRRCAALKYKEPIALYDDPHEGDIKRGRELGRAKGQMASRKFMYSKCHDCGRPKWIQLTKNGKSAERCHACARKHEASKRGIVHRDDGATIQSDGYAHVKIDKDNFFYSMANKEGYLPEHRLVMAMHLGRCLATWELVHHRDGDKLNNKIDNLELMMRSQHMIDHNKGYKDGYAKGLKDGRSKQIKELRIEFIKSKETNEKLVDAIENQTKLIRLMQWQIIDILGKCKVE